MGNATQYVHTLTVTLNVVSLTADGKSPADWWADRISDWLDHIESAAIVVSVVAEPLHAYKDHTSAEVAK